MESAEQTNGEYIFAPAGARGKLKVEIAGGRVRISAAASNRLRHDFSLSGLIGARWIDAGAGYWGAPWLSVRRLILKGPHDRLKLAVAIEPQSGKENIESFLGAARATLHAAAALNPGLEIVVGSTGIVRWLMSALGLVAVMLGLVTLFAVFGAIMAKEYETAAFFVAIGLALAGVGASMILSFNPFRPPGKVAAAAFAAKI